MHQTVEKVFEIFSAFYGKNWDQSRKPEGWVPSYVLWAEKLSKFDPKTILTAAMNCDRFHKDFGPTLPQFIDIVKKYQKDASPPALPKIHQENKVQSVDDLLETGGTTVAQREIAKIRRILAGEKLEDINASEVKHPEWDPSKYDRNSKSYDRNYAKKRRDYLVAMNDSDSQGLGLQERYDRLRMKAKETDFWDRVV